MQQQNDSFATPSCPGYLEAPHLLPARVLDCSPFESTLSAVCLAAPGSPETGYPESNPGDG